MMPTDPKLPVAHIHHDDYKAAIEFLSTTTCRGYCDWTVGGVRRWMHKAIAELMVLKDAYSLSTGGLTVLRNWINEDNTEADIDILIDAARALEAHKTDRRCEDDDQLIKGVRVEFY